MSLKLNVFEQFVELIQMKCLMRIDCLILNDFDLEIIYIYIYIDIIAN